MGIGTVDGDVGITRPVTHASILTLAVPIILSNITTPLVGLVDTMVIGQLGIASLVGGVAIGATIFSPLHWSFGILRLALYFAFAVLLMPSYGNHRLWAALVVFFIARGLLLGLRIPPLIRATTPA